MTENAVPGHRTPGRKTTVKSILRAALVVALAILIDGSIPGIAAAQSFPVIRAGQEVNPLGTNPTGPGGAIVVGNRLWIGDAVLGLVRCDPLDPLNTDPLHSGFIAPNPVTASPSVGKAGQMVIDPLLSNAAQVTAYVADYSGKTGGIKRVVIDVGSETIISVTKIAATAGLEGNQPTAVAYGPDGSVYVGFLKNGDIKRIVNPGVGSTQVVESVGTSPNGRKLRALAFLGTSLYMAIEDGLGVIPSATNIVGQIPNSQRVTTAASGMEYVGLVSDGVSKLYYLVSGPIGVVYELSPTFASFVSFFGVGADGGARAYHFPKGHTSLLALDPSGNLWLGDDPGGDAGIVTGVGRLFWAPASWLPRF
jgi:hypothetical protein